MTAVAERMGAPTSARTLRTLALLEARRYARHPLFLIGVVMLAFVTAATSDDRDAALGDTTIAPAFFLGVLGVIVGHGLARSMARSSEAVDAAPADGFTRAAALCAACLVPGAVALAWVAWVHVSMAVWPLLDSTSIGSRERAAMLLAGVIYAVGGPLVGVMVGRWTRFPGAGLLALVVLVVWTLLATYGLVMPASRIGTLVHLNAPYTGWVSSDTADHAVEWVAGGSPWWYLGYITMLCGLAATTAMLRGATGPRRAWLFRALVTFAVLAVTSLALAAVPDPTRVTL